MSQKTDNDEQTNHQVGGKNEPTELNDLVDQNLETMVAYYIRVEKELDPHQRVIEALTKNVGRPRFLYLMLLFVALWVGVHGLLAVFGIASFDPAPFYWLQGLIGLSGLVVATMVLITQNRQAKQAEHRRHLDLQVTLLVEQKVSKVIALVEELRRDLPSVRNRVDAEAEAMQEMVDPQDVLSTLENMFQEGYKVKEKEEAVQDE